MSGSNIKIQLKEYMTILDPEILATLGPRISLTPKASTQVDSNSIGNYHLITQEVKGSK